MPSNTTLNAGNLERLGAKHLAELLIEVSSGDASIKRRLRLALVENQGASALSSEVRKRLATIGRSRSWLDWQKIKPLAKDLETQHQTIVEKIGAEDPKLALELLWDFLGLFPSLMERCDDSNGRIGDLFQSAVGDLGPLASKVAGDPEALARRVLSALKNNSYGQYDDLIPVMAEALGSDGVAILKNLVQELASTPKEQPPEGERIAVRSRANGIIYREDLQKSFIDRTVKMALSDIADVEGDVDSYINQFTEQQRTVPRVATQISLRLLQAGRAEEALKVLDSAERKDAKFMPSNHDWENARIEVLTALGRTDEIKSMHWSCFEKDLSDNHLRAYLKMFPDFEDVEAEAKAIEFARNHRDFLSALSFLTKWPALKEAAELVISRSDELDGHMYNFLTRPAERLADRYPLATTLILRSMIDFALEQARYKRYKYAAQDLVECGRLAEHIEDFGKFGTHDVYLLRLKKDHPRKTGFWHLL